MLSRTDLVLTTAEECIPVYRRLGVRASFLQHGCNPELMRPAAPLEEHQFVLVANSYLGAHLMPFRRRSAEDILQPLIEAGYDVKVWGEGWGGPASPVKAPGVWGGPLPYERLPQAYAGAAIVLGLQCHNLSRTQTSCRIFEALACRALYLGPDTMGTRAYFTPGRHLLLSGSARETLALAAWYLERPAERARIAAAGQLEVYRRHTSLHRAEEFLAEVDRL